MTQTTAVGLGRVQHIQRYQLGGNAWGRRVAHTLQVQLGQSAEHTAEAGSMVHGGFGIQSSTTAEAQLTATPPARAACRAMCGLTSGNLGLWWLTATYRVSNRGRMRRCLPRPSV